MSQYLALYHLSDIHQFQSIKRKNPGSPLIPLSLCHFVTLRLQELGIPYLCFFEIIAQKSQTHSDRIARIQNAFHETVEMEPVTKSLFECVKVEAFFFVFDQLKLFEATSEFKSLYLIEKIYLFPPSSFTEIDFFHHLSAQKIPFLFIERTGWDTYPFILKIKRKLPYIGKELKNYIHFSKWFSAQSIFRRPHKNNIHNDHFDMFLGPIEFRTDLNKVLEVLENKKYPLKNVLVLLHPNLYKKDFNVLNEKKISYVFLKSLTQKKISKQRVDSLSFSLQQVFKKIYPEKLTSLFLQRLNIWRLPALFDELDLELKIYIEKYKPNQALLSSCFQPVSRFSCALYQQNGINVEGVFPVMDQMIHSQIAAGFQLPPLDKDLYFPNTLTVLSEKIARNLFQLKSNKEKNTFNYDFSSKLKPLLDPAHELLKKNLQNRAQTLRDLALPFNARYIVFTTQQHAYSFQFAKKMIHAFFIAKRSVNSSSPWHLVIKTHPLEFPWIYFIALFGRLNKYVHIIAKPRCTYEGLLANSEAVFSLNSFSMIESLLLGCKTVRMSFMLNHYFPQIEKEASYKTVFDQKNLVNELSHLMRLSDSNEEKIARAHQFLTHQFEITDKVSLCLSKSFSIKKNG